MNWVVAADPTLEPNRRFKLDMFNVALGIIAQCCLTILPMYIVMKQLKLPLLITIAVLLVIVVILKRTWWNKLEE